MLKFKNNIGLSAALLIFCLLYYSPYIVYTLPSLANEHVYIENISEPFLSDNLYEGEEMRIPNRKNTHNKHREPLINYKSIPVLMYHSINPKSVNNLIISPEEFNMQMKWLKDNNYNPISLEELYNALFREETVKANPIVLTFDDGYEDNYIYAYPILKGYGYKAVVFLITDAVNKDTVLKDYQITEMYNNNIDFQSHTSNHIELNTENYSNRLKAIKKSQDYIDKLLNKKTEYLCYPVGKYNKDTLKICSELGIKMAFTTNPGFSSAANGRYTMKRIRISPSKDLNNFINSIKK